MTRGKQTDLASALESLSRRLDKKSHGRFRQEQVIDAWRSTAGPSVYEHTTRAHLRGGELVIYVDSPLWATELSALAGPYTDAMNEALGKTLVKSVRFAVSRKVEIDRRDRREDTRVTDGALHDRPPRIPLEDHERAQVIESASSIRDEQLRHAVIRATIAGMEWQKGRKHAKEPETPPDGF